MSETEVAVPDRSPYPTAARGMPLTIINDAEPARVHGIGPRGQRGSRRFAQATGPERPAAS